MLLLQQQAGRVLVSKGFLDRSLSVWRLLRVLPVRQGLGASWKCYRHRLLPWRIRIQLHPLPRVLLRAYDLLPIPAGLQRPIGYRST